MKKTGERAELAAEGEVAISRIGINEICLVQSS